MTKENLSIQRFYQEAGYQRRVAFLAALIAGRDSERRARRSRRGAHSCRRAARSGFRAKIRALRLRHSTPAADGRAFPAGVES